MKQFSFYTAVAIIIANMIGTGVFTSLGFQLVNFSSPLIIGLLWSLGGVTAICGALCYAELASRFPNSGGEYQFISKTINHQLGFIGGWISATIGFSAPTALVAITSATYLQAVLPQINTQLFAIALVFLLALGHSQSHRSSAQTQVVFTILKVFFILAFIALAAFIFSTGQSELKLSQVTNQPTTDILSPEFAVALIYVSYAYTGWNAATYIIEEVKDPQRSIPRALLISTLFVTVVYVLLNLSFMILAPTSELSGQIDIGYIALAHALGADYANYLGILFALLLVSTASAMTLAGPRVIHAIARDYSNLKWFAKKHNNIPQRAIWTQATIAIAFIATSSFEYILVFSGSALALSSFVTVLGLVIERYRNPQGTHLFSAPLFPLPAIIYLCIIGATLGYLCVGAPQEVLTTTLLVTSGYLAYHLSSSRKKLRRDIFKPFKFKRIATWVSKK